LKLSSAVKIRVALLYNQKNILQIINDLEKFEKLELGKEFTSLAILLSI